MRLGRSNPVGHDACVEFAQVELRAHPRRVVGIDEVAERRRLDRRSCADLSETHDSDDDANAGTGAEQQVHGRKREGGSNASATKVRDRVSTRKLLWRGETVVQRRLAARAMKGKPPVRSDENAG